MSAQLQILILTFVVAIGLELGDANNISNQTSDFTVAPSIKFSRLVYALSVTGVVAVLMVIVALAGGLIRYKMERGKEQGNV